MISPRTILSVLLISLAVPASASAAMPTFSSMAGLGDSYTDGVLSGGDGDGCGALACPPASWSIGTSPAVDSHLLRLRRSGSPSIVATGGPNGIAETGAKMHDLWKGGGQADDARDQGAEYITIMVGLNDYCGVGADTDPSPPATFGTRFSQVLGKLAGAKRIFVASIFDATRLPATFTTPGERANIESKCPRYDHPDTPGLIAAYNTQLQAQCAARPNCRYDDGAFTAWKYSVADFASDNFHLSRIGQRNVAALTFPKAFPESAVVPPGTNPPGTGPKIRAFRNCSVATKNVIVANRRSNRIIGTRLGDRIFAGAGNDRVNSGRGNDCVDLSTGNDVASGSTGNDLIRGGTGRDRVSGNAGTDTLSGNSGNDRLNGGSGNDRISGDSGNDRIDGSTGRDRIDGASGNDRIVSRDRNTDLVSCGRGRDTVVADLRDRVSRNCEKVDRGASRGVAF